MVVFIKNVILKVIKYFTSLKNTANTIGIISAVYEKRVSPELHSKFPPNPPKFLNAQSTLGEFLADYIGLGINVKGGYHYQQFYIYPLVFQSDHLELSCFSYHQKIPFYRHHRCIILLQYPVTFGFQILWHKLRVLQWLH